MRELFLYTYADSMKNTITFKVYYKDTDAEGVVYYANYLEWFEIGRTELIKDMGISLPEIKDKHAIVFAVKDVFCEYLKPAKYGDEIILETFICQATPARITFKQLVKKNGNQELLTQAKVTLVALNINTLKPTRIPAQFKMATKLMQQP